MLTLATSRLLAYALCPFFLLVDFFRRFGSWIAEWPMILDDVIAGVLLLVAIARLRSARSDGRLWLVAAWAYGVGMMYGSFFGQLFEPDAPDPSGLPSRFVIGVKAALFAACIAGLAGAIRGDRASATR